MQPKEHDEVDATHCEHTMLSAFVASVFSRKHLILHRMRASMFTDRSSHPVTPTFTDEDALDRVVHLSLIIGSSCIRVGGCWCC